jgi:hypothetical protein
VVRSLFILLIAGIVAIAVPAHADVASKQRAARALFDAQVRTLNDGKLDAFVAAFVDSDTAGAMFVSSHFVATGRAAIRKAADEWAGTGRAATAVKVIGTPLVALKTDKTAAQRSGKLVVVHGDLEVTLRGKDRPITLRMTEVYSDGLDRAHDTALVVAAVFITEAVDDRELRGEEVLAQNTDIDRFVDMLRFPDLLAARFDGAADDLVIGSAAREHAQGRAATKLLQGWRATKLVVIGQPQVATALDWVYVLGTVSLQRGKNHKPAPLNVLLVGYPECLAQGCAGKDMVPHLVALHFGQAR